MGNMVFKLNVISIKVSVEAKDKNRSGRPVKIILRILEQVQ